MITVSPKSISEKSPRGYRSELRRQQAEATRARVLAASADLFAANGYGRTTLAAIGSAAGVSAETVQGQGPKAALLIAAVEYAAFGVAGEDNIFNLNIGRALFAIDEPRQAMSFAAKAVTEVHHRTARLYVALLSGSNSDPELDRYLTEFIAGIDGQARRVLSIFAERGWLRKDVDFDELVDTSAALCSVELYIRVVIRGSWTVERYRDWLQRMLMESILLVPQRN